MLSTKRCFGKTRHRSGSRRARAGAIVEFAVVLPLLLTILFGVIQYGWIFMVRQTLQSAAREGVRLAVLPTSVAPYTNVTNHVATVMAPTGLTPGDYLVTMSHATALNPVETVSIAVSYSDVSLVAGFFNTADYDLVGSCTMRKEGM